MTQKERISTRITRQSQRGSGRRGHQEEPHIGALALHAVHRYGHWRWQRETVRGSVTKSECRPAGLESCCLATVHFPVLRVPAGAVGFNMAYENLPLHMAITVQELQELKPDLYYFILHVSIDSSHSGAVGIRATTEHTTPARWDAAWRRVQAGVIPADGLSATPISPSSLSQTVERK